MAKDKKILKLTPEQLEYAYGLAPKEAIKFFESLGIAPSNGWQDTQKAIENNSFAVAGLTKMADIKAAKSICENALKNKEGLQLRDFKKQLVDQVRTRSAAHAELVVTQNVSNAYHAGAYERQQRSAKRLPYVRFVLGARTNHTDACLYLTKEGKIYRQDDPNIGDVYPAGHFHCGRTATVISEAKAKLMGYSVVKVSDIPDNFKNAKGFRRLPSTPLYDKVDLSEYDPDLAEKFKKEYEENKK